MFKVSNTALNTLLRFFSLLISQIASIPELENRKVISDIFPSSFVKAQKVVGLNRDDFKRLVCCGKCFAIYDIDDCYEHIGTQSVPRLCSSAKFPRHPWRSMRGLCNSPLLKEVITSHKKKHKPIKVYCYKSIISSITAIISRPGMAETCEHWRKRQAFQNVYGDIYDGRVWQDFVDSGFFSEPHSYGLLLNVDWFEPFEHSIYAVGVIFMALLNLPHSIRYHQENIIVCGLIPGPKEPSQSINSFLEPLVGELLLLWRGEEVELQTGSIRIRAALLCVSCDSPAMREVAGFVAHNASKGCFKCMKSFPTSAFGEKPDYSGFDRENWIAREHGDCVHVGMQHKHGKTAKERSGLEKRYGVRYTVLLTLPYYNAVSFCMIDPMHNLLLGSAKTFTKLWIQHSCQPCAFATIQRAVDAFVTPSGIGRLPGKVESGFSNFKAEQWKNWILLFSII